MHRLCPFSGLQPRQAAIACIAPPCHSQPENHEAICSDPVELVALSTPNIWTKVPTKWLKTAPMPFWSFVARRRRGAGVELPDTAVDLRCP